ncbi:tetratricopeptide repeat protein [Salinithrix halophila]|uniref:Tetratricopeptide repeat protein n=1 Tax=Salinithrix halophila TaxID=1485204 RepID=A0ABV8JLH4_9BACL
MGKFFIFWVLWLLTGNPLVSLLLLLLIVYLLDRRFTGFFPSATRPLKRNRRIRRLRQSLSHNPHNTSDKRELAHLLLEKKKYKEALPWLDEVLKTVPDSAASRADKGLALLKLGRLEEGEKLLLEALKMESRVYYGEPYLRLGEAFSKQNREKALTYMEKFKEMNTSSSEAYFRLGVLYHQFGRIEDARQAFGEAIEIYRALPKYKKRTERPWALRSSIRLGLLPSKK